jgi:two-component system sensor histidine kinase RegB
MVQIPSKAAPRVALPWIIRLRYFMAAGQIATMLVVHWILRIDLPLGWIALPAAVVVASNVWLARHHASVMPAADLAESRLINRIFALDTLCLTAVLMLSGGPNNPFTLLYLVHITLSATLLNRRQTWGLGVLATACYGALFWIYRPIPALEMHHYGGGASLHLIGMWVGFAVACLLITLFSGRISEQLRERERSLLTMQEELAKKDRLASLVTLAAGTAHELSTPLSTIAVVAKELEQYAALTEQNAAVAEDSRLIRTEVERCRTILERMSVEGAEPAGEASATVSIADLLRVVRTAMGADCALQVEAPAEARAQLTVPRHAVEQALIALVKNGFEASPHDAAVSLLASVSHGAARFEVCDSGCGIGVEAMRHVGEPFFTTKEPGEGMGLGVFLVRTLADRLGGHFSLKSEDGKGTTAILELPLSQAPERVVQ